MDAQFWLDKWAKGETGFHQAETNPYLKKYWSQLGLKKGDRVFVPLCGKTHDIAWLRAQGLNVVGVELAAAAVAGLFDSLQVTPTISEAAGFTQYSTDNLTVFQGDFFALTTELLGDVQAIYDRAALVALPVEMRKAYAAHLVEITQGAPQLLVTLSYDQSLLTGPPFSVTPEAVKHLYTKHYQVASLVSEPVEGGFKTVKTVTQAVWRLNRIEE